MLKDPVTIPIYPQDPGELRRVDVKVEGQGLLPGPIGPRVAVYEYNRDLDRVYGSATRKKRGGFPDYDANDHRAHQLNVYAITSRAVDLMEMELGRTLTWGFEASRLIVLPHAGYMANAFYEEDTHSLQFFSHQPAPGRKLYHTCLSHDIVAHETGHALLDAVRDRYTEATHPQTSAFHEALGDLTALFASLSYPSVRKKALANGPDGLDDANVVSVIAERFDVTGGIRKLYGGPDRRWRVTLQPHDLSLWLTRAVYDALVDFYFIGLNEGDDDDRALRVARRALQRMVVRGLDYMPPADGTYVEFAQAVIAADDFVNPRDSRGYRAALIKQLKRHKIVADADLEHRGRGVGESWSGMPRFWPRVTRQEAYQFLNENRKMLALSTNRDYRDFLVRELHLTTRPPEFREVEQVVMTYEYPVDVKIEFIDETVWIPVWGGGTLVFDWRGRLIHHAEKPVTKDRINGFNAFLDSDEAVRGVERVGATLDDRMHREHSRRPWALHVQGQDAVLRTNPAARCHPLPTRKGGAR